MTLLFYDFNGSKSSLTSRTNGAKPENTFACFGVGAGLIDDSNNEINSYRSVGDDTTINYSSKVLVPPDSQDSSRKLSIIQKESKRHEESPCFGANPRAKI